MNRRINDIAAATCFLLLTSFLPAKESFKQQQLQNARVHAARDEKDAYLKNLCQQKGITYPVKQLYIRVFKKEATLEAWVTNGAKYKLLKTYKICAVSGNLGPKRREGDLQTPEGFYHINDFNPASEFYLSLGINYPNAADRIRTTDREHPGSAIYIHGNCVSIGCMPIEDEGIKELYWLAVLAKSAGQKNIAVNIFPFRMSPDNMRWAMDKYKNNKPLLAFWNNIKTGYDAFEKNRQLPSVGVDSQGGYFFRG